MYGKFFASTFTGSMVGAGLNVFALWGYIIANARKDGTVELNPPIIAATLGCPVGEVQAAIQTLASPDPNSRSKKEEGRRIIQRAAFLYFIPTHADYQAIRDDAGRQEYMREYMREYRAKGKPVNANVNSCKPPLAHIDVDVDVDVDEKKKKELSGKPEKTPSKKRASMKTAMPENFGISQAVKEWAASKGHDRLNIHFENFVNQAQAQGYTYANWDAALRNAIAGNWAKLPTTATVTESPGGGRRAL